jgi:hypothetical protein
VLVILLGQCRGQSRQHRVHDAPGDRWEDENYSNSFEICRHWVRSCRSLLGRGPRLPPSFPDGRHSRLLLPRVDGLHFERTDADTYRPLDHPSAKPETVHRSGAADLFVSDDHLHVRDLDSVLPKLTS